MSHRYTAWSLTIDSELLLPEFLPGATDGAADVQIRTGTVPEQLDGAPVSKPGFDAEPGRLLLRVTDLARFLIEDGRRITIDASRAATEDAVRLFLLGSAFGALIHQRGWLPIHGSGIVVDGGTWLLTGNSGAGKSSLAAAFRKLGYHCSSDDVSVVRATAGETPEVLPGYPRAKLWLDVMKNLELDADDFERIRPELEKRSIPLDGEFHDQVSPLHRVIVLNSWNRDEFKLFEIEGVWKLRHLHRQTYRRQFRQPLASHREQWDHYLHAAQGVKIHMARRPDSGIPPTDLARRLLEAFGVDQAA